MPAVSGPCRYAWLHVDRWVGANGQGSGSKCQASSTSAAPDPRLPLVGQKRVAFLCNAPVQVPRMPLFSASPRPPSQRTKDNCFHHEGPRAGMFGSDRQRLPHHLVFDRRRRADRRRHRRRRSEPGRNASGRPRLPHAFAPRPHRRVAADDRRGRQPAPHTAQSACAGADHRSAQDACVQQRDLARLQSHPVGAHAAADFRATQIGRHGAAERQDH